MRLKKYLFWFVNCSLAAAIAMLAWIYGPSLFLEVRYQSQAKTADQPVAATTVPAGGFNSLMYSLTGFEEINQGTAALILPVSTDFGLVIPKIFANVAVTENVNPQEAAIYQTVLRQAGGVAHAAGSAVPGEPGTVYIFGHSTDSNLNVERFNAVFFLLRKLEAGDEIIAYYQNREYHYQVEAKKVVDPTDISDITDVSGESRLILQTCWPPGTDWKRLLVIAKEK